MERRTKKHARVGITQNPGVFMRASFFRRLPASRFRRRRPEGSPLPRPRLPGRISWMDLLCKSRGKPEADALREALRARYPQVKEVVHDF
ncbi:MAG: hypothetical protein BLITH_1606 [Brockia lithotrophica]|uniref:Uncharacterized protein n=1 Tax=Brockia lithotrophica TaxID=933949 RepID=A0A2T5G5R6_9BACL|nr:MAG: hypothetical protein BLITH_1606 [Brockia lithotrophica]